jgi:hypothetical protein
VPFDWSKHQGGRDFPEAFKFTEIGDTIEGTITNLRSTDFGGLSEPVPELTIDTGAAERTVAASQVMLRSALAEQAPQIGDFVKITYTGAVKARLPGRSPTKQFDVDVVHVGSPTVQREPQTRSGTTKVVDDVI